MKEIPINFVRAESPTVERSAQFEFDCIATILDALDALVYVSDMQTHELIFVNNYGKKTWGLPLGLKCYQYLQAGQEQPCTFCNNDKLLDANGQPADVHVWEFQNTVNKRWYQCRDQAIKWIDGRNVRIEIAVDITDMKLSSQQLEIARQEAEVLARIDSLTKVYNRRAFMEHMSTQFAYLKRSQQTFSLVMLDIDHFKKVNDQFGHTMGDTALVAIGHAIKTAIRESDQLFRIGGEEFAIALPDCDERRAFDLVERIRIEIESLQIEHKQHAIKLTCSFGISQYRNTPSIDTLISEADDALYLAKSNGRNQTRTFSEVSNGQVSHGLIRTE